MWFPFALSFALITSVGVIIAKRIIGRMDEYLYLFISGIFTLPFLFLIILTFYEIPKFDLIFTTSILASAILDVFAAIFAYRAIRISDVSLVAPLSAFNPVFTVGVSFVALGEKVGYQGVFGILLVCIGAYVLQISQTKKGWLTPLKSLLTSQGVKLSLAAYFIWAVTPIFQKTAILHTSPQVPPFASFSGMLVATLLFRSLMLKFSKTEGKLALVKKFVPLLILAGILGGAGQAAAFMAFSLTNLGFATAVFKLSMIFTVILGWLFFKEKSIQDRLAGSVIMLAGVLLLILK